MVVCEHLTNEFQKSNGSFWDKTISHSIGFTSNRLKILKKASIRQMITKEVHIWVGNTPNNNYRLKTFIYIRDFSIVNGTKKT